MNLTICANLAGFSSICQTNFIDQEKCLLFSDERQKQSINL